MFIICMNEEQMFNSISKLVTMGLRFEAEYDNLSISICGY